MARRMLSYGMIAGTLALTLGVSSAMAQYAPKAKAGNRTASASKRTVQPARHAAPRRTRSTTRISVTKIEAGGEVALPARTDTATVTFIRSDTVTRAVATTAVMDTTSIRRMIDTMGTSSAVVVPPFVMTRFGVVYVGVAAGASIPSGDVYNGYNPGKNVTMSMGLESLSGLTGLRLDVSYDQLRGRPTFRNNGQTTTIVTTFGGGYRTGAPSPSAPTGGTGSTGGSGSTGGYTGTARVAGQDTQLWSAMLDGKLRVPFFGSRASTALYVVAGGGVHYFGNYDGTFARTNPAAEQARFPNAADYDTVGTSYSTNSGYSTLTRFGANAGVGAQWGVGAAALFVEGRYVTVFTKDRRTNYWPVVLGVTFR
jgi:hypothetical protein